MLLEPYCFIEFVEENGVPIIKHIDNWSEGDVIFYFFEEDLVINMKECIHVIVAEQYLVKLNLPDLIDKLNTLNCPCPH